MKKKIWYFVLGISAFLVLLSMFSNSSSTNNPIETKKEVKVLWDLPKLMNISHNQIVKILGNPTVIEKFSDGKTETFKFVNGKMQLLSKENLPARVGMQTVDYEVYYKQSDCGMMVCGNDLWYGYVDPNKPVKYFYVTNYPVENPTFSVSELKQMGNLSSDSVIRVLPLIFGTRLAGIDICDKNYQGEVNIEGSERCAK